MVLFLYSKRLVIGALAAFAATSACTAYQTVDDYPRVSGSPSGAPTASATPPPTTIPDLSFSALYSAYHRESVPFRVLNQTPFGTKDSNPSVFRTEAEWKSALEGRDSATSSPPLDFSKEMLVVVHMQAGDNWTQCEISCVEEQAQGLLIHLVMWLPDPEPAKPSVEAFFTEAIAIPQTSMPVLLAPMLYGYRSQRPRATALDPQVPGDNPLPLPSPLRPKPLNGKAS